MKISNEAKVGGLILTTGLLVFLFAWIIGIQNPFQSSVQFFVTYNFAGGIEVGSPVRVSGIKVGKVENIEFFVPVDPQEVLPNGPSNIEFTETGKAISPLKLKISVRKEAALGLRKDSQFYINMAGIIGERYVEITPGHLEASPIKEGDTVAGIDPPRFDQLISQSFDLAGKMKEIIDENKADFTHSIELLTKLSGNLNKTLGWIDKSNLFKSDLSKLTDNLIAITSSFRKVTDQINTQEGKETLGLLHKLLWRLEPLDSEKIRGFLQKEGVRVKFF
jgi:phospholipid/cholesterol/gamma-HCH transport system substrate-binding protein